MTKETGSEARIQALEEKLAFQESALDELDKVVSVQTIEIQKLWDANRLLKQKLDAVGEGEGENVSEGPPPHY